MFCPANTSSAPSFKTPALSSGRLRTVSDTTLLAAYTINDGRNLPLSPREKITCRIKNAAKPIMTYQNV